MSNQTRKITPHLEPNHGPHYVVICDGAVVRETHLWGGDAAIRTLKPDTESGEYVYLKVGGQK